MWTVAAFYRFTPIADIPALRTEILDFGKTCSGLCGTILLAPEGINGTIAAHPGDLERMIDFLDEVPGVRSGELKFSHASEKPFNRFKVRPKKEIITLRKPEANPNTLAGTYVDPKDWNALVSDPDVTLIDTRNDYETKVGNFASALDPEIKVFSDFPDWVERTLNPATHKKVAMFCTGGIRCEKASAYMKSRGFEQVYHLKGGILQYLEDIPEDQSLWRGECFVFDKRVAIGHGLCEGDWRVCYGCRSPLSKEDTLSTDYEEGVSCPHCADSLTPEKAGVLRARHKDFLRQGA